MLSGRELDLVCRENKTQRKYINSFQDIDSRKWDEMRLNIDIKIINASIISKAVEMLI